MFAKQCFLKTSLCLHIDKLSLSISIICTNTNNIILQQFSNGCNRTRTYNHQIKGLQLCQLSYAPNSCFNNQLCSVCKCVRARCKTMFRNKLCNCKAFWKQHSRVCIRLKACNKTSVDVSNRATGLFSPKTHLL